MHPIAVLMLAQSLEEERMRAARGRRRWRDDELPAPPERRTGRSRFLRLPRFLRLAGSAG